ncbi:conserved hypothetical protein [Vibrio phage 137E35-1]|nr:conserved hypothetical protein [Vibrio phage 137E35-1]CAH9015955.1 conserved hypothetical protein [Vibrio phage 230E39-1]
MTPEELINPEFYAKGDLKWIKGQLILLNFEQKKEVCAEYREVYLKQGRYEANKYLLNYANSHGSGDNVNPKAFASGRIPEALQARIEKIKAGQSKKTILGMAEK